ncbi:MAG: hypothetical protein A3H27_11420 [Acidobacteria bacterium RIFCSPLOWO2_02_FULL_59_13]|nr:MAG: hypothetical protein A3H27_11420 [Acidobacteria bacterium RIFCSPLOWO2_02_FULL_59_13]
MPKTTVKPVITLRFTPQQLARGFKITIRPGKGKGEAEGGMVISPNETVTPKVSARPLTISELKETVLLTASKARKSSKSRAARKKA